MPAIADARRPTPSPLGLYARARIANLENESAQAARDYSAALIGAPGNNVIAARAYREAIEAGNFAVAIRAAQVIDQTGVTPPDAHLLLYVFLLQNRDWSAAALRLDLIAEEPGLGFLAPILGRWLESASRTPVMLRGPKILERSANAYAAESDALIALAQQDYVNATIAIKASWILDPYRATSLRLAAASGLAEQKQRTRALDLLVAENEATEKARKAISDGRRLGLSVTSPTEGAAFVLARAAGDLIVEGRGRSGLTIARIAEFAAPKNARIKLLVASALSARKRHEAALALANAVLDDPVYGADAASLRIDQLEAVGQVETALTEARSGAAFSPNNQTRIGDMEMRRQNFAAAAAAYNVALEALGAKASSSLVFATANAYDYAGKWGAAKPLLERALALAPEEPAILNELGYGLITNGDDLERGLALVAKAASLRPDDAAIVDSLGWAHFKRGAVTLAVPLLERAVRLDQTQPEISEHLGDAYWAAGRRIDARYAWVAARVYADGEAAARLDAKIAGKP